MSDTPYNNDAAEEREDAELNAEAGLDADPDGEFAHEDHEDDLGPVDALIAERDEWKDRALRAAAEADNTRRRAEREMNDARAYAIQRFSRDLLGVADNLARALQAAPKDVADPAVGGLVTGLEMIEKSLLTAFENNGLVRVAPESGEKFDPNLHDAMMEQPSDTVAAGLVIQTMQPGYALFGRVVRPAMVVVAARGSGGGASGGSQEPGSRLDAKV